jgi:hypothetical protein
MPATKKELILAVMVMLLIPVFGELALRAVNIQFDTQFYGPDSDLGWTLRAEAMGIFSTETRQFVVINKHGFRDAEREYDKPANTVRVAVLGNSWTEAMQVPLNKTYCAMLEKRLVEKSCFGAQRVEVLNFGVAGYSTAQELLTLRKEVWKYHPDVVIVAVYAARDIANNVRELNNAVDPERSPYFIFKGDRLVLDDSFRTVPALQPQQIILQNLSYKINDHSRVLQGLTALQRFAKIRVAMAAARERTEKSGMENLEYSIYKAPTLSAMQTGWRITEALLLEMRDEVKAHGAEFRTVILATRPQVIPEREQRVALAKKLGMEDLSYADKRIKEFGRLEGIAVTILAPALSAYAEEHLVYLNGFNRSNLGAGHWNETGHQVAAEAIASDLCAERTRKSSGTGITDR